MFVSPVCVAQWIERWPVKRIVTSSILDLGSGLGGGAVAWVAGQVFLSHDVYLSLSFSLPFPLSKNKYSL